MYPKYILSGEVILIDGQPQLLINWKDTLPLEPESLLFVEYIRRVRTKKQIIHWLATDGKVASEGRLLKWFANLINAPAMIAITDDQDWKSFEGFTLSANESFDETKYPTLQRLLDLQVRDSEGKAFIWGIDEPLTTFLDELDSAIYANDAFLTPEQVGGARQQRVRRSFPSK